MKLRQDNANVAIMMQKLQQQANFLGILGGVNLAELEEMTRAMRTAVKRRWEAMVKVGMRL